MHLSDYSDIDLSHNVQFCLIVGFYVQLKGRLCVVYIVCVAADIMSRGEASQCVCVTDVMLMTDGH